MYLILGTLGIWGGLVFAQTSAPGMPATTAPSFTIKTGADGEHRRLLPPIVSNDGSRVAVSTTDADGNNEQTTIYDLRGGQAIYQVPKLKSGDQFLGFRVFSPDGKQIVINTQHGDSSHTLEVIYLSPQN